MAGSNLSLVVRRRVEELLRELTFPALDLMLSSQDVVHGIREATARAGLPSLIAAAIELQAAGAQPTDGALARCGGPSSDSVGRLLRAVDLSALPGIQLRVAVDGELVAAPERIVVESWTETVRGPAKFGATHLHPPPQLMDLARRPRSAPHTAGGIATALAFADCGRSCSPVGDVQIQQGYWHPNGWPRSDPIEIKARLRGAGDFHGLDRHFVATP